MFDIDVEREQLVETWKSAFRTNWTTRPRSCVRRLVDPEHNKVGSQFRQLHNIFGWMAGSTLARRGLCSGAIYRSVSFMELAQPGRNGSCGPRKSQLHLQKVHIEHTIPIAELSKRWLTHRDTTAVDVVEAYAWTLVHSVVTAVHHKLEKGRLGQYESRTDAFDADSQDFGLPFMRYEHMDEPPVIWNVLSGQRIDARSWTFQHHFSMVSRLMKEAEGDPIMCEMVEARSHKILASMP